MSTVQSAPPKITSPRHRRRRARWRWLLGLLVLVALIVVVGVLAAVRLLHVLRDGEHARTELTAFKTTLTAGDTEQAATQLAAAKRDIRSAQSAYGSFWVTLVGHLPVLGNAVSDAGHLLRAADDVSRAGTDALMLYQQVRGEHSRLFHDDTVDLAELKTVDRHAAAMVGLLTTAEHELLTMHAASWEPKIPHARDQALGQVRSLRKTGQDAHSFLKVLPPAVGAAGPRTYLIMILNPAELQGAGGSALSMITVRFVRGHMNILQTGATYDLTNENALIHWKHLRADPWLHGAENLASADRSPDFRTSGAELMRAYTAQFHQRLDGIIALDPLAMQDLMPQLGSFTTPGYGVITPDNLARTVLIDSYVKVTNFELRHAYNEALMQQLMHRLLGGGHMFGKAQALAKAAHAGHLQVLMRDPALQEQAAKAGLLRTLPPSTGDVVGVYTTNTNASKVDVWQQRSVTEKATVNPHGSVSVVRTVTVRNGAPAYSGPGADPGTGYLTRVSHPRVTNYFNGAAKIVRWQGGSRMIRATERGLLAVSVLAPALNPGQAAKIVVRYTLPPGTAPRGILPVAVAAQPTYLPVRLRLAVSSSGGCRAAAAGWAVAGDTAQLDGPMQVRADTVRCAA